MKRLIIILLVVFLISISIGAYLVNTNHPKGHLVVGLSVCFMAFILMPCFIYYRYKGDKYKKYQINDEMINTMRENSKK